MYLSGVSPFILSKCLHLKIAAMFKRTKGYVLLTLLVVTGLASGVSNPTLTGKERKFLVQQLKNSKEDLQESVKGLSTSQLEFKSAPDKWSIKQCVQHLALTEEGLWAWAEGTLKSPAAPEKRSEIKMSDEDLLKTMNNRSQKAQAVEQFQPDKAPWQTTNEALDAFKQKRKQIIKYVKTTTADVRSHVAQSSYFGAVDAYQQLLLIAAHTQRHIQQIEEIKSSPGFPKD